MMYFIVAAVLVAAVALLLRVLIPYVAPAAVEGDLNNSQNPVSPELGQLMRIVSNEPNVTHSNGDGDVFSEERLKRDLEMLAEYPTLYEQYVYRTRIRLKKKGEIKILDHWTRFFQSGARLVRAKTDLGQARSEYKLLPFDERIKLKKKEFELAQLQADIEEQRTRRHTAIQQRQSSAAKELPIKSEDDIKQEAAFEHHRRDISFDVRLKAGKKLTTLKELQKWFREERKAIFADDSLNKEEAEQQYDQLVQSFNEYRRQLNSDTEIFEDD